MWRKKWRQLLCVFRVLPEGWNLSNVVVSYLLNQKSWHTTISLYVWFPANSALYTNWSGQRVLGGLSWWKEKTDETAHTITGATGPRYPQPLRITRYVWRYLNLLLGERPLLVSTSRAGRQVARLPGHTYFEWVLVSFHRSSSRK